MLTDSQAIDPGFLGISNRSQTRAARKSDDGHITVPLAQRHETGHLLFGEGDLFAAEIGQGQVWSGRDAKERGLVDRLGGYKAAIDQGKEEVGLEASQKVALKPFPEPRDTWRAISEDLLSGRFASSDFFQALARGLQTLHRAEQGLELLSGERRPATLSAPALPQAQ